MCDQSTATMGASKNRRPLRTTACTLRTSSSTSHKAIVELCITSSKRCPPGLRASKRHMYPSGSWGRLKPRFGVANYRLDPDHRRRTDYAVATSCRALSRGRVIAAVLGDTEDHRASEHALINLRRASDTEFARGFGHETCLPARAAAMTCSACRYVGLSISTASSRHRRGGPRSSCTPAVLPTCRQGFGVGPASGSHRATTSHFGCSRYPGRSAGDISNADDTSRRRSRCSPPAGSSYGQPRPS